MSESPTGLPTGLEAGQAVRLPASRAWLPRMTLARPAAEAAAVALLCPLLLSAALWNGFPFTFFDTGAYLLEGLAHVFVPERAAVYSLFLGYAGARESFWIVAWIQAFLTAFTVTQFARAERPETGLMEMLGIGLLLVLLTSAAWFVGQIEPDCFTALLVLSLYLLAFRARALGLARSAALVLIAALAVGAHPSHLGLAAGLLICVGLVKLARLWRRRLPRVNLARPALAVAMGLGLVLAANYALAHKLFLSRSGAVFMAARMMDEGTVKRLLDDTCPGSHFKLCAYRNELPKHADEYLWESRIFDRLGRFAGTEKESQRIVAESLARYPLANLKGALAGALLQFADFRTGDGIEPQQWVLSRVFKAFVPRQVHAYLHARQQHGALHFRALNAIHLTVAILAMVGLAAMGWDALSRRRWKRASLPGFVFLALLGNALICGAVSGPHDRYQSRLIWVPVLALLVTARPKLEPALRAAAENAAG